MERVYCLKAIAISKLQLVESLPLVLPDLLIFQRKSETRIFHSNVAGTGAPFQGPRVGSCLILGNELSEFILKRKEVLLERNTQRHRASVEGNIGALLSAWLTASGSMVAGFISRSSLT